MSAVQPTRLSTNETFTPYGEAARALNRGSAEPATNSAYQSDALDESACRLMYR
jgi:hypothetical protein